MTSREIIMDCLKGAFWGAIIGLSISSLIFVGAIVGYQRAKVDHPACFEVTE